MNMIGYHTSSSHFKQASSKHHFNDQNPQHHSDSNGLRKPRSCTQETPKDMGLRSFLRQLNHQTVERRTIFSGSLEVVWCNPYTFDTGQNLAVPNKNLPKNTCDFPRHPCAGNPHFFIPKSLVGRPIPGSTRLTRPRYTIMLEKTCSSRICQKKASR